ncbi:MBOAT-domain-containing protein [Obba rivulosa]|uniref:O-acyltransferase n=1 Tax=Obba rivulosa TaxID=1052685 RepID=A0A8E2DUX4_9APHY|nr:MBOAT-domain-containing protein [Obba rivulosa]
MSSTKITTRAPLSSESQNKDAPPLLDRSPSVAGFQTAEGTLYVSKPFRSSETHKLRALITFQPRKSHFDINNESSSGNEFRGFFTLFWISMFLLALRTYIMRIETSGYALEMAFAKMFSRDALGLAMADAVLVLSTAICVPFAKAVSHGLINYNHAGVVLQHLWQTMVLFIAITWTFNRQWPWVQSGFLTLHTLVMIMKMHSYMSTNGQLQTVRVEAEQVSAQLRDAIDAEGGWDAAMDVAEANKANKEAAKHKANGDTVKLENGEIVSVREGTPDMPAGSTRSYIDPGAAVALRRRLTAAREDGIHTSPLSTEKSVRGVPTPSEVLTHHPSPRIAELAKTHAELESELTSTGPEHVRYPDNISLKNFAVYQLIPTLVYELEYPRTDRIRPMYVFEKTVATFGTFALLYTVVESFILTQTPTPDQSFFRSLLDLALPFMISYLLLFYIIFECICNGFAELSYFADRKFYDDWIYLLTLRWNSTSWDEFSRKWNRPVHTFLLRHVYASSITSYKLTRRRAMFLTFLLSAAVHELVMAIVTKKIRMYLFTLQLAQIPLIAVGRMPVIKRNKLLGNIVFWVGLYAGFPLLCVAYVAY